MLTSKKVEITSNFRIARLAWTLVGMEYLPCRDPADHVLVQPGPQKSHEGRDRLGGGDTSEFRKIRPRLRIRQRGKLDDNDDEKSERCKLK